MRRSLMLLILLLSSGLAWGQEVAEHQVKAAFLYKFTGYVEWPNSAFAQPDSPVVIGVMDADEVAQELTRMVTGRRAGNRPLVVRRVDASDALTDLHVLFVGRAAAQARQDKALAAARGNPVLTISDSEDALAQGSIIGLRVVDEQMRFQVSVPAATRNALKISSRLLSVAHQVVTEP